MQGKLMEMTVNKSHLQAGALFETHFFTAGKRISQYRISSHFTSHQDLKLSLYVFYALAGNFVEAKINDGSV
jgi:hypothetical protein